MRWKLDGEFSPRRLTREFEEGRFRKITAERAYNRYREVPVSRWAPVVVVGLFVALYEGRYRRNWLGTGELLLSVYRDLQSLISLYGIEDTVRGLRAVFTSRELAWVTVSQLPFLCNRNNWARFIVPVITKKDIAPAPWTGETEERTGAVEVSI